MSFGDEISGDFSEFFNSVFGRSPQVTPDVNFDDFIGSEDIDPVRKTISKLEAGNNVDEQTIARLRSEIDKCEQEIASRNEVIAALRRGGKSRGAGARR